MVRRICEKYTGVLPSHLEGETIDQLLLLVCPIEALGGKPFGEGTPPGPVRDGERVPAGHGAD